MHPRDNSNSEPARSLALAYRRHERHLWGLCYRMTGTAADADDVVQDTFARAMERPPPRTDVDWRPWLVRVAINLCRDRLRQRKRRAYSGPWLPGLIETGEPDALLSGVADRSAAALVTGQTASTRYELLESVSLAFLLALEALTPTQRAVLILRDALDYSGRETARALALSESNVKTTLHRARKAMNGYERLPRPDPAKIGQRTEQILTRFMAALNSQDADTIEGMLRDDVRALSDGGGVYNAAARPIFGRDRVVRLYLKLAKKLGVPERWEIQPINGRPALLTWITPPSPRIARFSVTAIDVDNAGLIAEIYAIMAPDKLTAL
ncbi:MAG: sigma-70 family RNA polymerase sigma factor [Proteobacteria bacterium]|nr:sigma-70 family RNA polymerase sigma factor [Pseudomonadota bacterium]